MELLFAIILFAFQIYCDFEGYTKLAIGSAEILGFNLNENFTSPYLALSVKEFWKRWHISLTSWFRDYLYIPLGGNRKGNAHKQINTMIVFLFSGLWHGAAWHFVIWGGINGMFCVIEDLISPVKEKVYSWLNIRKTSISHHLFQRFLTFFLVDFSWLFFRAATFRNSLYILKKIFLDFRLEWFLNMEFYYLFKSSNSMMIIFTSLLLLLFVDSLKYHGKDIKTIIFRQPIIFRWLFYWIFFMVIIYWGLFGAEYEQTQFIYFQF